MIQFFKSILDFLNSNLSVVTLAVGLFAIYLYLKGKKDYKRDAARLILQEIRYAEQQIRNSGRGLRGYSLAAKLLPTNNWNNNIHIFTKDLKETEIDMVGEFYSKATYIDFLITERSHQRLNQEFETRHITRTANQFDSSMAPQPLPSGNLSFQPTQEITQMIPIPNPNENTAIQLLHEISLQVEFIYNTPVMEKLRKIAEKKWYQPF